MHEASVQDRDGAKLVLLLASRIIHPLMLVWADGGYAGKLVDWLKATIWGWRLEIVRRRDDLKGFVVLPHRWIVERTFAWFENYRLLAKEYETSVKTVRPTLIWP